MTTPARFDLKLDPEDKALFSLAAAKMGTTMAGFVRTAAKAKAQEILERETRLQVSRADMATFAAALDAGFKPNAALRAVLDEVRDIPRGD